MFAVGQGNQIGTTRVDIRVAIAIVVAGVHCGELNSLGGLEFHKVFASLQVVEQVETSVAIAIRSGTVL